MSQWTERIRNHVVWKQMETLGALLDKAESKSGNTPSAVVGLERLRTVLTYCGKRLAAIDPDLGQIAPLDILNASLAAISNEVETFLNDSDATHFVTANTHADKAINAFVSLPFPCPPDDLTAISEAAASYRDALEVYLNGAAEANRKAAETVLNLTTRLNELAAEQTAFGTKAAAASESLASLSKQIEAQQTLTTTALTEQKASFTAAQTERAAAFSTSEASRQATFTAAAAEQQKIFLAAESERQNAYAAESAAHKEQFNTAQTARQTEYAATAAENQKSFTEAQASRQSAYTALVADYTKKLADQNNEFSNQREAASRAHKTDLDILQNNYENAANKILNRVVEHEDEVKKLVGVIGNTATTSGYLNTANSAQDSQRLWQKITVGALILLAGIAVYTFGKGSNTWESLASHLLASLPAIILAAYAGSQADKYHQIEKRNRKLALELAAIGPYLAPLPPEMRNKFRAEIGERTFGHHEYGNHPPDKSPATVIDLIDELSKSEKLKEWLTSIRK